MNFYLLLYILIILYSFNIIHFNVSSTFNNTYKYNDIAYPTILEDVKLFEIINELCINIYNINDTSGIITHQVGNIK